MQLKNVSRMAVAALIALAAATANAQIGTAFNYQGQLLNAGQPVDGLIDVRFTLFDQSTGGNLIAGTVETSNVPASGGLFAANVDFGFDPYTSDRALFLQIEVRSPADSGSFVALDARQPLTAAPFSLATRGINVTGSNQVGIGTSSPRSLLHVFGTGDFTDGPVPYGIFETFSFQDDFNRFGPQVRLKHGGPGGQDWVMVSAGAGNGTAGSFYLLRSGSSNIPLAISPTDNVGIGGTNPQAKLEVSDGTGSDANRWGTLQISRPDTMPGSHISFLRTGDDVMGLGYRAQGTNIFGFGTGDTGTNFTPNRLAINNDNGHVGIGTTTPQSFLDVRRPVQIGTAPVAIFGVDDCGAPCGEENYYENIRLVNNNQFGQTGMGFLTQSNAPVGSTPDVWTGTGFKIDSGDQSNDFIIATKTNPTTLTNRVRVNGDNGNVGIGTDTPQARLHNVGITRTDGELQFGAQTWTGTTGTNAKFYRFPGNPTTGSNLYLDLSSQDVSAFILQRNGQDRIWLQSDGSALKIGGGAWGVLSDQRTKNDIQTLTGTLDRLLQLKGHAYTYKSEFVEAGRALPGVQIGLVAQEVETIFPDWVSTGADGLKVVTERSTTALMVEALRDLRTEKDDQIEVLKARLEKLEALLATQTGQVGK